MKYFKNTELANLYKVSEKSVRNWIEAAQSNKVDLQLYKSGERHFVANTAKNILLIEQLVEKGKKYKNSRGFKTITPTQKFYDIYSPKQVHDIISNLTVHHEIPLQYTYVDGGADYWDKFAQRLFVEETPNLMNSTIQLLESSLDDLYRLTEGHKKINIVDLGPGNGLPVRSLLERLLADGRLNRYVTIDSSKEMLQIAEAHVKKWFDGRVTFEGHVRDFSHERFDDLFLEDYANEEPPVNIILLLGGTLCNFRSPAQSLQAINNSMSLDDVLVYSTKLDTPNSRRYFDFNISSENQGLTPRHRLPLDLLNVDDSLYEVEQVFDEQQKARFISVRLKVALSLKFALSNGARVVEMDKNDSIILWRYWHQDVLDVINQFSANDFDPMHAARTKDEEFLLLVSRIKPGNVANE